MIKFKTPEECRDAVRLELTMLAGNFLLEIVACTLSLHSAQMKEAEAEHFISRLLYSSQARDLLTEMNWLERSFDYALKFASEISSMPLQTAPTRIRTLGVMISHSSLRSSKEVKARLNAVDDYLVSI